MEIKIIRGNIKEIDMVSAGISVLAQEQLISDELYWDLRDGDKLTRNITVGEMIRDYKEVDLSRLVDDRIKEFVNKFIAENNISPKNILEVAKDAVFIYKVNPKKLTFGEYVTFSCKHTYHMLLEFPVTAGSSNKIKLYKEYPTGLRCRGGHLDREREEYYILLELMIAILNKDSVKFNQQLRLLSKAFTKTDERLIRGVENTWLLQILKEIML